MAANSLLAGAVQALCVIAWRGAKGANAREHPGQGHLAAEPHRRGEYVEEQPQRLRVGC